MTTTTESTTPTQNGTDVTVSIFLDAASEVTARDNPRCNDLVGLRFDNRNIAILGDLASVQRIIDDAAHQLMLISTARAAAEEHTSDRGKKNVALLRGAVDRARADAQAAR